MTDVEVLKSYRYAVLEITAIDEQMEALMTQSAPAGLTSPRLGGVRGTNVREARISQNMELCEEQLEACRKRLHRMMKQFERVVSKASDERTRAVLRLYYASGMTDERIGMSMGLSTRTISNVRRRFLKDCEQRVPA